MTIANTRARWRVRLVEAIDALTEHEVAAIQDEGFEPQLTWHGPRTDGTAFLTLDVLRRASEGRKLRGDCDVYEEYLQRVTR